MIEVWDTYYGTIQNIRGENKMGNTKYEEAIQKLINAFIELSKLQITMSSASLVLSSAISTRDAEWIKAIDDLQGEWQGVNDAYCPMWVLELRNIKTKLNAKMNPDIPEPVKDNTKKQNIRSQIISILTDWWIEDYHTELEYVADKILTAIEQAGYVKLQSVIGDTDEQ